jgi:hypothetical protein
MTNITDLARHWTRQSDKGKGIRIEADALDVLNAIGVGELIMAKAAEHQREKCSSRIQSSTRAANTASPMTADGTVLSDRPSSRSSGTTSQQDVTAAARRAQRTSNRRRTS